MEEVEILEKEWEDDKKDKATDNPKKRAYEQWAGSEGEGKIDGSRGAAADRGADADKAEEEARRKRQKREPAEYVIKVKKEDMRVALDALKSTIEATKKAGDFFANGAAAFKGQEVVLNEAKAVFEKMLARK